MSRERQPVLGPPMDGRRSFEPMRGPMPGLGPRSLTPTMFERYPRSLPPIPRVMPQPMMPGRFVAPPTLMPWWGGQRAMQDMKKYGKDKVHIGDKTGEKVTKGRPKALGPPPAVIPNPVSQQSPVIQPQIPTRPKVVTIPIYVKKRIRKIVVPKKKKKVNKTPRKHNLNSEALMRFRYAVIAVMFIEHLKINLRKVVDNRPSSVFLFGIILKEIVAALHRIYLNPDGNIYPVLSDIIGVNCYDLSALVHGPLNEQEEAVLIQELQYVLENVIYHITEIMPTTGVLGTHKKSAVFELIRNGKRFPDGYFWQVEMDRLQFSDSGRTVNNGDYECFLLLIGIFVSRSMVTTLLMKPTDYGLLSTDLTDVAERNLRIVATTLLYLVRRVTQSRAQGMMGVPSEISKYLYDDGEMQHVYSRMARTFNYCEGLLREWGTEYVRRLRDSSFKK